MKMTREQNIFLARRNIVDYIFKSAKMEGFGVTFPETDVIFNGMTAPGIPVDEVIAINNLKRAWQYMLSTLDEKVDFDYLSKLNRFVGGDNLIIGSGQIRKMAVSIGGTTWQPEIPVVETINLKMIQILKQEDATLRALEMMLFCMRGQFFNDGNKRTAMLLANKLMIDHGQGIISIPIAKQLKFKQLLTDFYETADDRRITKFLLENCIELMDFSKINENY